MTSVQMFDHLVKVNGLEEVMVRHGLTLPDDLIFIKEQIAGPLDNCVLDGSVCVSLLSVAASWTCYDSIA